ncbi:DNA-binding protein H-NS [Paraburkholderia fungorum]|uniref:DNA-binding protein H-NS n=1 Tax=Paraburkholderia fungorum TaxID=134537 RepID=A0A1H1I5T7_9BURK|nr:DNA-binding protein H-NS [Paraburkholderia fungorum]
MATTLEAIQEKLTQLRAESAELSARRSDAVLNTISQLMGKYGLTTADIDSYKKAELERRTGPQSADKSETLDVKFRDPETGATWNGRGRPPALLPSVEDPAAYLFALADSPVVRPSTGQAKGATRKDTSLRVVQAVRAAQKKASAK